jgi:uncharacterized protein YciI
MYVLNGSYAKPPAEVERHVKAHGEWVKSGLERGLILFAGRKKSGLGGIVVVKSMDKAELLKFIAEDIYAEADLVEYQITDFDCSLVQPNITGLAGL